MSGDVVVCGGGIVGAAAAYFLTLRGLKPLVVEQRAIAAAASGKAGGFLARGWGDGSPTESLHHKGFDLHQQLAKTLGIKSFRQIPTLGVTGGKRSPAPSPCGWLDGEVARCNVTDRNTAQVNPKEVTEALMHAAQANGASLVIGTVEGLRCEADASGGQSVTEVVVDGKAIKARAVVIALGPWSVWAADWLGLAVPMEGIWSSSIVYRGPPTRPTVEAPFALFCSEDRNGCHLEVYPRHDGDVYVCGLGGSKHMGPAQIKKLTAETVIPDPNRVAAAHKSLAAMTSVVGDGPTTQQACMRPCLTDALPMIGAVPGVANAYIGCGHNCWGILWGPITGLILSELLVDGHSTTVDLAPFSPDRFGPAKATAHSRGRHHGAAAVGEQW